MSIKIKKNGTSIIQGADDDLDEGLDEGFEEGGYIDEDPDSFVDTLEDVQDTVEDIQDDVDDIEKDDIDIETDNNITDHYIAECDNCHGVFISSVILSDQELEKVSGVCPLCDKESDQYLKWIIKDVKDIVEE